MTQSLKILHWRQVSLRVGAIIVLMPATGIVISVLTFSLGGRGDVTGYASVALLTVIFTARVIRQQGKGWPNAIAAGIFVTLFPTLMIYGFFFFVLFYPGCC